MVLTNSIRNLAISHKTIALELKDFNNIGHNVTVNTKLPIPLEGGEIHYIDESLEVYIYTDSDDLSAINNKKDEGKAFQEFLTRKYNGRIPNDDMNLEYLLPAITLFHQISSHIYGQMDNFLMPIWKFNKLTAKHILDHDLTKEYIQCIQVRAVILMKL